MITIQEFIDRNKDCIKDGWVFCTEDGDWYWQKEKPESYWIIGATPLYQFDIKPQTVLKKSKRQYKSLVATKKIIEKMEVKRERNKKIDNIIKLVAFSFLIGLLSGFLKAFTSEYFSGWIAGGILGIAYCKIFMIGHKKDSNQ